MGLYLHVVIGSAAAAGQSSSIWAFLCDTHTARLADPSVHALASNRLESNKLEE